jgi:hypothetical protein
MKRFYNDQSLNHRGSSVAGSASSNPPRFQRKNILQWCFIIMRADLHDLPLTLKKAAPRESITAYRDRLAGCAGQISRRAAPRFRLSVFITRPCCSPGCAERPEAALPRIHPNALSVAAALRRYRRRQAAPIPQLAPQLQPISRRFHMNSLRHPRAFPGGSPGWPESSDQLTEFGFAWARVARTWSVSHRSLLTP